MLILLIFYGGQDLLNRVAPMLGYDDYIDLNPLAAGIGTLGFIFGAYLSETFRGAFMAIPKGQAEAGMAYGMSPFQVFFRVLVPQMIRLAIPGFTNNWLVLTKATALISVVGLQDMMFKAKQAADATREPFTFFLAVAAMYLVLTSVSLLALRQHQPVIGKARDRQANHLRHQYPEKHLKRTHRSEERRVGKECRSRWSPYH